MRHLSIASDRDLAIVAFVASLVFLSGCSNASVAPMAQNAAPVQRSTSDGYSWQEVDYPKTSDNQVTGINNSQEVVGNYSSDGGTTWDSYVSPAGYTSYNPVTYPSSKSTYLYAVNNDAADTKVGYVVDPQEEPGSIWATVDYKGLWSLLSRIPSEEQCPQTKTHELLGYGDSNQTAVGFFTSGSACTWLPFEVAPGDAVTQISIPAGWGGNNEATGIDSAKDIVGSTLYPGTAAKIPAGWLLTYGSTSPTQMWCCGGSVHYPTAFSGITIEGALGYVIVGHYTDAKSKVHGFVYTQNGSSHWTFPIDEPNSFEKSYTVINGINESGDICGWYQKYSSSGSYYGFVGVSTSTLRKRR